jgi:hypothetical protein
MEVERRKALQILFENGIKVPKKLRKMTGTPLSTVYRTIAKIKLSQGPKNKPGSGAKRKIVGNDYLRRVT